VSVVRLDAVTVRFGERVILEACSVVFEPGCHAITGPSGSGKTTVLNVIAGYLVPQEGRVTTSGRVGYLLQEDALFTSLSAADNLAIQLGVGVSQPKRSQTRDLLSVVGLGALSGQPVSSLSGGERKRLQLAMTMSQRPGVLLLDEPTATLDDANKSILAGLLAELFDGVCVIIATHDLDFLASLPGARVRRLVKGGLADA